MEKFHSLAPRTEINPLFSYYLLARAFPAMLIILFFTIAFCLVQRLYFHPLAKIPGLRIAAATSWYEFYHDVICDGTYVENFMRLHKEYDSPVIRISPNHVHVNDPNFYGEIFHMGTTYYKAPYYYKSLFNESIVGILNPERHHTRRRTVQSMFSVKAIDSMAPYIIRRARKAAESVANRAQQGLPINLNRLYRSISADITCELLFGKTQSLLDAGKEQPKLIDSIDTFTSHVWLVKHFPFLNWMALNMPDTIAAWLIPGYKNFRAQAEILVKDAVKRKSDGLGIAEDGSKTIFDLLLEPNSAKGGNQLEMHELIDEAFMFILGGTDPIGFTLAAATYYILTSPDVLMKLMTELQEAKSSIEGEYDWKHVQKLPYLTAILKETMRLYTVVPGVLPRVVPPKGAFVQSHFLPGGTIISASHHAIHHNPSIFVDPENFDPERWLGSQSQKLEKYLLPFSKGPRACLGINLAWLEMYTLLAVMFSRFEMTLFETSNLEWLDHGIAVHQSPVQVSIKLDRRNI